MDSRKIVNLTKEELMLLIETSTSINQILKKLNVNSNGSGAYRTFKKHCLTLQIEIPKYKPIGKKTSFKAMPLEEILIENSNYQNMSRLKKRLIEKKILVYKCYNCGISDWNNTYISLHIEHINGIHTDNRLENLQLLCPNCHSQTKTYAGKNKKYKKIVKQKSEINYNREHLRKVLRPNLETLLMDVKDYGYCATGRKYNVSDNCIRKWIKQYQIIKN